MAYKLHIPLLPTVLYLINRVVFSVVLPPSAVVGRNTFFAYSGLGTVVHARARIGSGVHVGTGVTIGGRSELLEVPVVEDDVLIGTGAKILGPIVIGRGAKIGANAVVLSDVAAGETAVGIPAKSVKKKS